MKRSTRGDANIARTGCSKVRTPPARCHKPTDRTDYNALHCSVTIWYLFNIFCNMSSTIQTIDKFNSNKNWLALWPKNVTELSFASVRMCYCKRLSAHNFVGVCLKTTPTTSEVLRCRSPLRCLPSSLTCQTLRRRDVVQSPFTVVEVDLSLWRCCDDYRCCRKPHGSLRSLSLTGTIF